MKPDKKTEITKQAIGKYELGKMNPTSEVLITLSNTLAVKPDFFFRSSHVKLGKLCFRKKFPLSKKEEETIKFKTFEFLERYNHLEEILGIKKKFNNPLSGLEVKSFDDSEKAAEKLRHKWQLGISPIMNLVNLLEKMGIKIFYVKSKQKLDGLSILSSSSPIIVLNNQKPQDRKRFTAAHELAHILCEFSKEANHETLCHYFASAFLLPREVLTKELISKRDHLTFWELGIIKENFGISIQAILHRARSLEIITENHFNKMLSKMKEKDWDKEEPVKFKGREDPRHFNQLLNYALTENIISKGKAAELANVSVSEIQEMFLAKWE